MRWWYVPDHDLKRADPWHAAFFEKLARTTAESELTEKVLLARAARMANGGRWPVAIPDFEKSVVQNRKWIYTASRDGVSIRIQPPIVFPRLLPPAPLYYELR